MTIPLRLVDQGHLLSAKLVEHIRERAEKLSRFFGRVKECRVTVDGAGLHSRAGRVRVRVYLQLRDVRIDINRRSGDELPAAFGRPSTPRTSALRTTRGSGKGRRGAAPRETHEDIPCPESREARIDHDMRASDSLNLLRGWMRRQMRDPPWNDPEWNEVRDEVKVAGPVEGAAAEKARIRGRARDIHAATLTADELVEILAPSANPRNGTSGVTGVENPDGEPTHDNGGV